MEPLNVESQKEDDNYTKDGTVDYRNKPANKKTTGTWKACPFILGTFVTFDAWCTTTSMQYLHLAIAFSYLVIEENTSCWCFFNIDRKWMLWAIGILWDEHKFVALFQASPQPAQYCRFKESLELVRYMLYHATYRSVCGWCLSRTILDHR